VESTEEYTIINDSLRLKIAQYVSDCPHQNLPVLLDILEPFLKPATIEYYAKNTYTISVPFIPPAEFPQMVKEYIEREKITQTKLAEMIGLTKYKLSDCLSGRRKISKRNFDKFIEISTK
jgi:hypothetical protein